MDALQVRRTAGSIALAVALAAFCGPQAALAGSSTDTLAAVEVRYHTVHFGETLWIIADRYGTTVEAMARTNGIENPNLIFAGVRLRIPGSSGSGGGGGRSWGVHVVRQGELLWEIAARYDTTTAVLMGNNEIPNPDALPIGMRLRVPAAGGGPSGGGRGGSSDNDGGGGGASWGVHVVRRGDLLWEIAARYDTTTAVLMGNNEIPNPDALPIGMRLRVPAAGGGPSGGRGGGSSGGDNGGGGGGRGSPPGWGIHVVRPGELLWQIAQRHGTTVSNLIAHNDIPNGDALTIGTRLRVPGGVAAPPSFSCPVPGSFFIDTFGAPRPGGRIHEGIDLMAPRGTPVLAPMSGHVMAWFGSIGGRQIRLIGDDGHDYSATHLSRFAVSGGWVAQGQVIGYVGTSGNAMGLTPHLHFEYHPNRGRAVNPFGMLSAAC